MREVDFDKNAAFESERLRFRGITSADAENLVRWRSRKDIYTVSGQARPVTMAEHLGWFSRYIVSPAALRMIISSREAGLDIGMVGGEYSEGKFVLSYYIGEIEHRGKGFASEAITALIGHLRSAYNLQRFSANVLDDNAASIACLSKLGFIRVENPINKSFHEYILE